MEQALTLLTLRQVTYEANELPFSLVRDFPDRELHREYRSIPSLADDNTPHSNDLSFSGSEIMTQIAVMLMTVRRGHQHADIPSLNLGSGESEQALGGCAKGLDYPPLVDDHHRIRDSLENGPQMSMAERELLVCSAKLAGGALISKKKRAHCRAQHCQYGHRRRDQGCQDSVAAGPLLAFAEKSYFGLPELS
jgi:hypothetical protein